MRKQTRTLIEIGLAFLATSILLDYFLGAYQILLWLALAFEFILFGTMILNTLWERVARGTVKQEPSKPQSEDPLERLEHLCKLAIEEGDQAAADILSERVRSLAYTAAANKFDTSEADLRTMSEAEPALLQARVGNLDLFNFLTRKSTMIRSGDTKALENLLGNVEEWTI